MKLDQYAHQNGLGDVHPGEKLSFGFFTMLICMISPSPRIAVIVVLIMAAITIGKGCIPFSFYIKMLSIPFGFLVISIAAIGVSALPTGEVGLWSLQVGTIRMGITAASLQRAAGIFIRSFGSISCLYFMILTTPMVDILTLLKKLHFPQLLIEMISLIYRFIFVLLETADRIRIAQASRLGYENIRNGYRSLGMLTTALFLGAYKRAENVYMALEARGYDGELRVLEKEYQVSRSNVWWIFGIEVGLIVLSWVLGG